LVNVKKLSDFDTFAEDIMKIPSHKEIWMLTYPIILSLFAENVINITDTIFLARVGEAELGASAIGGTFYVILFIIGLAFSIGTQIIISRRLGENKPEQAGSVFELSLFFLVFAAALIFALIYIFSPVIFRWIISSEDIYEKTLLYINYRIFGIFFTYIACVFRAFYTGIFKTKYLAVNSVVLAGVNVVFAYLLIFGKFGFPEMGIAGAGLATVIAEFVAVSYFVFITFRVVDRKKYRLFKRKTYDLRVIKNILDVSGFIILQHLISLMAWFSFFVVIEHRGQHELAITNIVRSVYVFLMIPGWAFGSACNTLVSNIIGQGNPGGVLQLIRKITFLCFVAIIALVIPAQIFHDTILSWFTADKALINESLNSYYMVMLALVIFSLTMNYYNGLIGTGRTRAAMYIELLGVVFYLVTLYLIVNRFSLPLEFAWSCEIVYFTAMFLFSYIYLKKGSWKLRPI
jgi:putative MATE family efflux protein